MQRHALIISVKEEASSNNNTNTNTFNACMKTKQLHVIRICKLIVFEEINIFDKACCEYIIVHI